MIIVYHIFSHVQDSGLTRHMTSANMPQLNLGNAKFYNPSDFFARARLV